MDKVGTEHRELYGKSHIAHVTLLSDLAEIFACFLDLPLRQKSDTQVLHDEHIVRSDGQRPLEEDDPLFHISCHGVGPSQVAEDFWIVGAFGVGLFEMSYGRLKIVAYQGHISAQIESCRSPCFEGF